jgi:hypothetical protein
VAFDSNVSPTDAFFDAALCYSKVKGKLPVRAEFQGSRGVALDESLRFASAREPRRPNLDGHAGGIRAAAVASGIHQQVAEPPCAAAVGQSATQKPDLIAPLHAPRRIDGIHGPGVHASFRPALCSDFITQRLQDGEKGGVESWSGIADAYRESSKTWPIHF